MQAKEVVRRKFAKAFNAHISLGNQAVDCSPAPSTGERGVASVLSTSGHCHFGRLHWTHLLAHFPHVCARSRAMMPKLFGQLRAFLFLWRRKTCRTQTHIHRILNTRWQAIRAQPRTAKSASLYLPSFYRCALRLLGNRADAEDAVQEALLAAHKHLHQFRGQSRMSTWLTTIVCNCARMQLRKQPRQIICVG